MHCTVRLVPSADHAVSPTCPEHHDAAIRSHRQLASHPAPPSVTVTCRHPLDYLVMRRSGRHDAQPAAVAAAGPLPDDHPAAALWWCILDQLPETPTNTRPPRGSPSDPARDHQVTRQQPPRPGSAPPPAFGPAAENIDASQCRRSVSRSLLPNPSTDRGRLVRGGAWHFVPYRGYDISVKDGSAKRSRQLPGVPLTCTSPTYPQGVRP